MRQFPQLVCLLLLAASASLIAAPWNRSKEKVAVNAAVKTSHWADELEVGPYSFFSEFPLEDLQDLIQDLADLQDDLETSLGVQCQPQSIHVYLFNSKRSYEQYVRAREPAGVNRRALYLPARNAGDASQVFAYRNRELEIDVRHELTHALLHTALPDLPIWIDEGIAEYFEVPAAERAKSHVHHTEIKNAITWYRWKPAIEKLESKRKLRDMDGQDYRDSWAIVHYILNGPPEAREALRQYFVEIRSSASPTPLSQHLRKRIPNLDQAILEHLRK